MLLCAICGRLCVARSTNPHPSGSQSFSFSRPTTRTFKYLLQIKYSTGGFSFKCDFNYWDFSICFVTLVAASFILSSTLPTTFARASYKYLGIIKMVNFNENFFLSQRIITRSAFRFMFFVPRSRHPPKKPSSIKTKTRKKTETETKNSLLLLVRWRRGEGEGDRRRWWYFVVSRYNFRVVFQFLAGILFYSSSPLTFSIVFLFVY